MNPGLVIATHNRHKLDEIRDILAARIPNFDSSALRCAADFRVPEPVEDGADFAQNALIKARALSDALGVPALADDSGLCVDILGGAPGIFSARWCGVHGDDAANLALLLAQLADVKPPLRGAHFMCTAVLAFPGRESVSCVGKLFGTLRSAPAGTGGFGYDPIFQPEGCRHTLAELSAEEKNRISHRAQAFRRMARILTEKLPRLSGRS
ncbi:RdgB/HAM1 family non-canonical purine NTP pyrophosphatase [Arcanobacterium sp. S3PF19]|uniref:RdgB/HAM1 family non-canonical purine NTP pyrophosphatase n=1 Tax=Arcanobacterium sp. S3PF19 TaxID=1219585 RepID=UPI000551828E|nr:RdgB/HAM1 family non-canonical purine NTP pyrophosphatase [Arcanobacterium sp. S3PF19]